MPNKAETFARSETHINLMRAFAGESQARNRYTIAAGMAREKNLYVVQQVFLFTADQELTHAKQFYRQLADLSGQTIRADGTYPVDLYPDLLSHLRAAQHNEFQEPTSPRQPARRASPWWLSCSTPLQASSASTASGSAASPICWSGRSCSSPP